MPDALARVGLLDPLRTALTTTPDMLQAALSVASFPSTIDATPIQTGKRAAIKGLGPMGDPTVPLPEQPSLRARNIT